MNDFLCRTVYGSRTASSNCFVRLLVIRMSENIDRKTSD